LRRDGVREARVVTRSIMGRLYDAFYPPPPEPAMEAPPAAMVVASSVGPAPVRLGIHDGEKYAGGFGITELLSADYWTLRTRSTQLFKQNLYARGIIRRLVTNIINTGLALEATPDEQILGVELDSLGDWAEMVENRFHLWERSPNLCDHLELEAFGALQASAKRTALVSGDVLVVMLQDKRTGLPRVRLVDGSRVQSPFGLGPLDPKVAPGHVVKHGVELDREGRHVAYWLTSVDDATGQRRIERLPRVGPTGRRLAWLVYGTDKLLDEVRGEPLLSIILQSLREVDRYRDAVQRKAAINAIVAMFIKKEQQTVGTRPITGGAQLRGSAVAQSSTGAPKAYRFTEMIPGAVLDELAPGEEPHGFPPTGTDEKFSDFEAAIVYAVAWALEIPPEILTLSFNSNYSASQAAINEFKLYLNPVRASWGDDFCQPIYTDWLISECLSGRITARGLLESWRDPMQYDRFTAWSVADWSGAIKPSVDLTKMAEGYEKLVAQGFLSRDRATRETTGTKFSKNVKKLERENLALAKANAPLAPPTPKAPGAAPPAAEREGDDDESETKPRRRAAAAGHLTRVESTE
jgi:lambda family phage portal protein